jgi:hypothetical protein
MMHDQVGNFHQSITRERPEPLCALSRKNANGQETNPALSLSGYYFVFLGPGTRDPVWALSTLYRGHRCYGFLLVGSDDRDVSFLNYA